MFCNEWGLMVNMNKTNTLIFKKIGFKDCEKWHSAEKYINVEYCLNYLVVVFPSHLF